MNTTEAVETRDDVLAAVQATVGFVPSEKQLKDWRRAGLFHRPLDQRGSGRGHGSITLYPSGSGDLLAAICRHSRPKKSLPQMTVLVWWDGYTLPNADLVRSALNLALDDWERQTQPWVSLDDVTVDDRIKLDRQLSTRLPAALRVVRDRVGKKLFTHIVETLLNVAAGGFKGFHPYPPATGDDVRKRLELALGINQAGWIEHGLVGILPELSATLNPTALRQVLEDSTAADLDLARDEMRDLVALMDTMRYLTHWIGGDAGKPFTHLDAGSLSSGNLAMLTLFWLSASRRPALRRKYRELVSITRQLRAIRQQLDTIQTIDTQKPPRRRQPSEGTASSVRSTQCPTSLSPSPPPDRDTGF